MENVEENKLNELQSLNVNFIQQEDLEKGLNAKLSRTIAQNEDELDQKRLEKAQKKLDGLNAKLATLKKRLQNPFIKISEKTYVQKQIHSLESSDLIALQNDVSEIEIRRAQRRQELEGNVQAEEQPTDGRLPNESERDYLMRTGKITAFGNTSSFNVQKSSLNSDVNQTQDEEPPTPATQDSTVPIEEETEEELEDTRKKLKIKDEDNVDEEYVPSEELEVESKAESDESEYLLSDVEMDTQKVNLKTQKKQKAVAKTDTTAKEKDPDTINIDDGDEKFYQKRLKRWVSLRHALRQRKNMSIDSNIHEWYLPHPEFNDAVLNSEFKVPGEIFKNLFDYQKTCVQWLWELYSQKVGGIIGDEMGLGKTIQVISFLASLHYSKKLALPVLIVCPSTVMKQWVNECHTWWPAFRAVILHSIGSGMLGYNDAKDLDNDLYELVEDDDDDNRIKRSLSSSKMQARAEALVHRVFQKGHVVITTYAGLKIYSKILLKRRWGYVVLDEGHKIRNPNAEVSLAAKRLRTPHRIILSGTPIQNNLTELWSLFDFVYPGKLGTLPIFQQEFVVPINMGGYANASNVQVQTSLKCAIALKNLITPYLLRRLKSDVAKDLPKKTEMVLFCKLTNYQQKKYLDFLKSTDTEAILSGRKHALYGIDILKKICNHPDLLLLNDNFQKGNKPAPKNRKRGRNSVKDDESVASDGDDDDGGDYDGNDSSDFTLTTHSTTDKHFGDPARSGKLQVLKTLILLWKSEGHKILLFTQTRQMLNILEKFIQTLDNGSINYLRMDGTTPIKNRQVLMDSFNNDPQLHIFLLTTRVGGLGVNLIGADRVIIFDPDWNPSTDIQARERAWRLGQKKDVTIYRLMTKGTIEEKIYQRQIFKQFLSNKVLKDPNQKRVFKMNELNDLFTYGNEDDDETEEYYRNPKLSNRVVPRKKAKKTDDFMQVAKITGVAGLETFNTGEGENDAENNTAVSKARKKVAKDEDRVLGDLLESTGIKASIQQDDVENSLTAKDKDSIIQKEAERIANEAVSSLMKSRKLARQNRIGVPTWTGKFGTAGKVVKKSVSRGPQSASTGIARRAASPAGMAVGAGAFSSAAILQKLNAKKQYEEQQKQELRSGNNSSFSPLPGLLSDDSNAIVSGYASPTGIANQSANQSLSPAPSAAVSAASGAANGSGAGTVVDSQFTDYLLSNKEKIADGVRDYLAKQPNRFSKSKEIIDHLDIEMKNDSDIKLVRSMLRQIAEWDKARSGWILKQEFQ